MFMEHEEQHHLLTNNVPNPDQTQQQPRSRLMLYLYDVPLLNSVFYDTDICLSLVVAVPFWFLVSLFIIYGFYGSVNVQLNQNYSMLLESNSFFVQSIQVKQIQSQNSKLMLYGFREPPSLDTEVYWIEKHNVTTFLGEHKHWLFYLNKGSKVTVSYIVNSTSFATLALVILQGRHSLTEWLVDPSDPSSALSWNIIFESGEIQLEISKSDFYYIAVGNVDSEEVKVQLNFGFNALLYNTTEACYSCEIDGRKCSFTLHFLQPNAAVLTSPGRKEASDDDDYSHVKVSYGARWISYIVGSGIMCVIMVLSFKFCKVSSMRNTEPTRTSPDTNNQPKDDDCFSDSSCLDTSADEDSVEGSSKKGICVICSDAPRDCFFLPCGHAASCFACARRIEEGDRLCPVCSKVIKKVQRILMV